MATTHYTATAKDTYDRTASDTLNLSLPATLNFAYDYNGDLTNDGRRVFEYDSENQLTNVYVAGAWRSEFKYDAFGRRRVRREYTWQSSAWVKTNEVRYVYDGLLTVQERDANNLAMVSYTRGNDLSGTRQGAGGIGGLLARTDHSTRISQPSAAHAYYHCDGNGNVTALVDTNGSIIARYQYDPYGNLLGMSGPLAEANTYRFSSKEWCANAGLYYYGFRFYEPNLQRWPNRDPLGDIASLPVRTIGIAPLYESDDGGGMTDGEFQGAMARINLSLYTAVGNNPVSMIDTFGLDPFQLFPDPDAAAKDAACYIKKHRLEIKDEHFEQSAAIFKGKDGKYYYNFPQHGKSVFPAVSDADYDFKKDPKDTLAGHIHDHVRGERFSDKNDPPKGTPKDIELYKTKSIPGYLLTPKGDIKKYDPKTDKTTTIGNCK